MSILPSLGRVLLPLCFCSILLFGEVFSDRPNIHSIKEASTNCELWQVDTIDSALSRAKDLAKAAR